MVPHISSTENTMSFVFRESKESLHDTCRSFGRCVAKNTCTQQNNLTFLQNCLGSDYSSIAEKERKKRHQLMKGWMLSIIIQARLRSTVTEERMLSLAALSLKGHSQVTLFLKLRILWIKAQLPRLSAEPALPTQDCSEKQLRHV